MSGKLKAEIAKTGAFESPELEAFLNLLRTADVLQAQVNEMLKPMGISATQYNVLRILRGAGCGLACREIGQRMIHRDPDITRLLDRLEERNLLSRQRDQQDRRVIHTRITETGLELLNSLDEPMQALHRRQLGHLGERKLNQFIDLLEKAREGKPGG